MTIYGLARTCTWCPKCLEDLDLSIERGGDLCRECFTEVDLQRWQAEERAAAIALGQ